MKSMCSLRPKQISHGFRPLVVVCFEPMLGPKIREFFCKKNFKASKLNRVKFLSEISAGTLRHENRSSISPAVTMLLAKEVCSTGRVAKTSKQNVEILKKVRVLQLLQGALMFSTLKLLQTTIFHRGTPCANLTGIDLYVCVQCTCCSPTILTWHFHNCTKGLAAARARGADLPLKRDIWRSL